MPKLCGWQRFWERSSAPGRPRDGRSRRQFVNYCRYGQFEGEAKFFLRGLNSWPSPIPIGYAVVGLGSIAETAVFPAFRSAKKSKLVALVSHDKSRAQQLGAKFGVKHCYSYGHYDDCLRQPGVDAVFIASVNSAHAEQTIRAAAAGKHVLCEKPMATSVEDCGRMVPACRANGVRLMIAYRKDFEPGECGAERSWSRAVSWAASGTFFRVTPRSLIPAKPRPGN